MRPYLSSLQQLKVTATSRPTIILEYHDITKMPKKGTILFKKLVYNFFLYIASISSEFLPLGITKYIFSYRGSYYLLQLVKSSFPSCRLRYATGVPSVLSLSPP